MPTKSKRKLVWLEKHWEERRRATVLRVENAIKALLKEKRSVSIRLICNKVREQTGHNLSANTIKQNPAAYDLYCQYTSNRSKFKLKDSALVQLFKECPEQERSALQTKVSRLKQVTKEDLVARLIRAEQEVKESRLVEIKIRERLIELEIIVHNRKKS